MRKTGQKGNKQFWLDPATCRSYTAKKDVPSYLLTSGRLQHWDSMLEYKVSQFLEVWFPKVNLVRQKELVLYPKNNAFPKLSWKIDFCLEFPKPVYVEAKGEWLRKDAEAEIFWRTLRGVEDKRPDVFNRLFFVDDKGGWKIPHTNLQVLEIQQLHSHLDAINKVR